MRFSDRIWLSSGVATMLLFANIATPKPPHILVGLTIGSLCWVSFTLATHGLGRRVRNGHSANL